MPLKSVCELHNESYYDELFYIQDETGYYGYCPFCIQKLILDNKLKPIRSTKEIPY